MKLKNNKLSYKETVKNLFLFAEKYESDLVDFKYTILMDFYRFVQNLEYREDPKGVEFLSRPLYTLQKDFPHRDCDDKTLIFLCYLGLHKLPKIVLISGIDRPSHVFPATRIKNNLILLDATYKSSKFDQIEVNQKVFDIYLSHEF